MKIIAYLWLISFCSVVFADEMVHKFKSPSFNGQGVSAHYLTIENQETSRKNDAKAAVQAALDELERDAQNTTLARFMKNLESRIYSQLSRDLVDNLFADGIGTEAAGRLRSVGSVKRYRSGHKS